MMLDGISCEELRELLLKVALVTEIIEAVVVFYTNLKNRFVIQ
jgi:hypothetical protein